MPAVLPPLQGYLLDFSEPTEDKSGVWMGRTSDSVFHLLFLGKGLEQAQETHWADTAPNLSICLNRSKTLMAKAQAWGHTSMGLLVFLPHLCLVASPPKSLMNKGTLPWHCLASG